MKMPQMLQRHEVLPSGTRVDRDWWIVAKLVAMTVTVALIAAAVFGVL